MTTVLYSSCTLSMIFMFMNHPLSLGAILLLQTILIALASGMMFLNFWFSYILFLVMIGGMLVMFIYMTSIASNEKFSMPKNSQYFIYMNLVIILSLSLSPDNFLTTLSSPEILSHQQPLSLNNFNMSKYFNYPGMNMMIVLMMYLLVTLIAIVKITDKSMGTLRSK
uniref:NADH-ubiquinone oxidoreductase chain 6 n=1 Tax=Trigonopterus daun TaxID=2896816 RepID=A0A7H1KI41_9CUCU|nr:NADH dehydrogenase subunit 6 [Trigonopterus daun]